MNPLTNEELIDTCYANISGMSGIIKQERISELHELLTRFRKLTQPEIKVEHFDHSRVVMTKISNGDTYTSYSEELYDFLHEYNKIKLTQPEQVSGEVVRIVESLREAGCLMNPRHEVNVRNAIQTALNGKIDKPLK